MVQTPGSDRPPHGQVEVVAGGGRTSVLLSGEIDVAVAAAFRDRVRDALVDGHVDVVVDLSAVTFMDSSGLGSLIAAMRQTRVYRGSFAVRDPSPPVRRLLAVTAMDRVIVVRDGTDDET